MKTLLTYLCSLFLFISFLSFNPTKSYACSCVQPPPVEEALERKTAVFSGKVLNIKEKSMNFEVTLKVSESWKGVNETEVVIKTAKDSAACGFNFMEGEEYLVYAYGDKNLLETGICERTATLAEAGEDLAILGEGKVPTETPESKNFTWIFTLIGLIAIGTGLFIWKKK